MVEIVDGCPLLMAPNPPRVPTREHEGSHRSRGASVRYSGDRGGSGTKVRLSFMVGLDGLTAPIRSATTGIRYVFYPAGRVTTSPILGRGLLDPNGSTETTRAWLAVSTSSSTHASSGSRRPLSRGSSNASALSSTQSPELLDMEERYLSNGARRAARTSAGGGSDYRREPR